MKQAPAVIETYDRAEGKTSPGTYIRGDISGPCPHVIMHRREGGEVRTMTATVEVKQAWIELQQAIKSAVR